MLSEYSFSLGIQFLFRLHTGNSDKQLKKKNPQLVQEEETIF